MLQRIYTKNAAYQKFEVLKTNRNKRYRYYEFFVEGVRNINQTVQNGWEIASFSLNRTLKESCDILATIPMSGKSSASSFNVGCAATVFLYEAIRQRL